MERWLEMTITFAALRGAKLTLLNVENMHGDAQVAVVQTCCNSMSWCNAHKEEMLLIDLHGTLGAG